MSTLIITKCRLEPFENQSICLAIDDTAFGGPRTQHSSFISNIRIERISRKCSSGNTLLYFVFFFHMTFASFCEIFIFVCSCFIFASLGFRIHFYLFAKHDHIILNPGNNTKLIE